MYMGRYMLDKESTMEGKLDKKERTVEREAR